MSHFRTALWVVGGLLVGVSALAAIRYAKVSFNVSQPVRPAASVSPTISIAQSPPMQQNNASSTSQKLEAKSGWKIYRNDTHRFEIQYPSAWAAEDVNNNSSSWVVDPDPPMVGGELLMIDVPSSAIAESTNVHAQIFLGVSTDAGDVSNCATGTPYRVGSTTFHEFDYHDAALAASYYNVDYETERNGACYAVQYLFTSALTPPANVKSVDPKTLVPLLDRVIQTFRFVE
jgi:hypothetical protein